jgi:two-component system C4-dicarboxylate transport sensor histidine kinase DctB
MVYANPFLLQEILSILLTNAIEAIETQKHPTVWVTTFRSLNSNEAGFKVEDNGSGLAPEYRQHLFKPFMSTKTTEKGTGLGLHLADKMVQELKGRLNYQERSGGGAGFIVILPTEAWR